MIYQPTSPSLVSTIYGSGNVWNATSVFKSVSETPSCPWRVGKKRKKQEVLGKDKLEFKMPKYLLLFPNK